MAKSKGQAQVDSTTRLGDIDLPDLEWKVGNVFHLRVLEGQSVLKGSTTILGVNHHVVFVEVQDNDGEQVAVNDPDNYLDDILRLNDGILETVRIPGMAGEFAVVVYPYAD